MKSVVIPETTNTVFTVSVPLKNDSTVELTSNKAVNIYNTNSEFVNTSIKGPGSESGSNASVTLSGNYETLTIENVGISKPGGSTGMNPASVKNLVISENTTNSVNISLSFENGATITNNSDCKVTLNNSNDGADATIVAPNSTVTLSSGQWGVLESTVGENTLYINSSAHIQTLKVLKGNVIVNDYSVEEHIDNIINDTQYTVTPKIIEVYTQSDWAKASSTPALYEVQNDLTVTNRIAPGLFGSKARIKLNGHTVTCSDSLAAFMLRGTSHYIIENGTIIESGDGYGVWLSGAGTVELKDVTIIGNSHSLYIEKTGGKFITSGICKFDVAGEDKTFVLNYLDKVWTDGYHDGFVLGEGTEIVGQDVAASMSEPNGPVNMLPVGYHTESREESGQTIYTVVKDSE